MNFLEILGKPIQNVSVPWIQQYAPKKLEEITGNRKVIDSLQYYLYNKNIPNLIITGPNGSGKQTAVRALLNEYLGEHRQTASIVIYGAISRGKDVVSEKNDQKKGDKSYDGPNIINFIKRKMTLPNGLCKIIVIYDFDQMTQEAQTALRRIIELYSEKTRFILTCNGIKKVAEAIQSRCVIVKFTRLSNGEIEEVLYSLAEKEGINLPEDVVEIICLSAYGDLKQAVNYLQVLSRANNVSLESFYQIFNMPPLDMIQKFINACLEDKIDTAYEIIIKLLDNGYNVSDILDILLKVVAFNQVKGSKFLKGMKGGVLDPEIQINFLQAINHCFYLTEISSSQTHLYNLVCQFIKIKDGKFDTKFMII